MEWLEFQLVTSFESSDFIQTILVERGAGGVVVDDPALFNAMQGVIIEPGEPLPEIVLPPDRRVIVKAYFQDSPQTRQLISSLELYLADMAGRELINETEVSVKHVDDDDWAHAWKQYFNPHRIGEKFIVVPSWKFDEAIRSMIDCNNLAPIIIDPGMAFGTGNHPTTALSLELIEEKVQADDSFLDVGTGSGILSIAAARLGARVQAVDIDSLAVSIAEANIKTNSVEEVVTVSVCDITDDSSRFAAGLRDHSFDLVVANIVAEVIVRLLPSMAQLMSSGGMIVLSGIIDSKLDSVLTALEKVGLSVLEMREDREWRALVAG